MNHDRQRGFELLFLFLILSNFEMTLWIWDMPKKPKTNVYSENNLAVLQTVFLLND